MISFYDLLEDNLGNYEEITDLLISFDHMLELLHNNGLCIYDFNPKKIIMYDGKFTYQSFNGLLNDIGVDPKMKEINILQLSKIGLYAYKNVMANGIMNQKCLDDISTLMEEKLINNDDGNIPDEIYEYYGEVFVNGNIGYLNDYLVKKQQEANGQENSIVMRKSKSTPAGRALAVEENAAFVGILFIPTLITLIYLIGLIIYFVLIK